jgi:hypothetical protein
MAGWVTEPQVVLEENIVGEEPDTIRLLSPIGMGEGLQLPCQPASTLMRVCLRLEGVPQQAPVPSRKTICRRVIPCGLMDGCRLPQFHRGLCNGPMYLPSRTTLREQERIDQELEVESRRARNEANAVSRMVCDDTVAAFMSVITADPLSVSAFAPTLDAMSHSSVFGTKASDVDVLAGPKVWKQKVRIAKAPFDAKSCSRASSRMKSPRRTYAQNRLYPVDINQIEQDSFPSAVAQEKFFMLSTSRLWDVL